MDGALSRQAFEDWYRGAHPRLFASMLVLTGDRDVAAEVTDEALARALRHWGRIRETESPEGWTYRVAVNLWRRTVRRHAMERRLLPRLVTRDVAAAPAGEVWDVVRSLTKRQRQAVVLRYVADLGELEIAEVMGVSRGTVASTLSDARRSLANLLVERDTVEGAS